MTCSITRFNSQKMIGNEWIEDRTKINMNAIHRVPLLFCHHDLGLYAFDISSCSAQTDDGDNDNDIENKDKDDDGDHSCYSSHWPTDVFDFWEFFIAVFRHLLFHSPVQIYMPEVHRLSCCSFTFYDIAFVLHVVYLAFVLCFLIAFIQLTVGIISTAIPSVHIHITTNV